MQVFYRFYRGFMMVLWGLRVGFRSPTAPCPAMLMLLIHRIVRKTYVIAAWDLFGGL